MLWYQPKHYVMWKPQLPFFSRFRRRRAADEAAAAAAAVAAAVEAVATSASAADGAARTAELLARWGGRER